MKRNTALKSWQDWRRLFALVAVVTILASLMPMGATLAADPEVGTGNQVEIVESTSGNGFTHPGVGLTKSILENMREQVQAKKEPWYSYYVAMTASANASKTVTSSNASSTDPTKPGTTAFNSQGFNSKFIADGLKAYTQTVMYYITGDETYRANAMRIIRIWSQMDPSKYVYFTDSHIHTGIPLNRMVTAAEILRYTSSQTTDLQWTAKDTTDFTNNLITPVIETFQHSNNYFMNQHNYPLLGAMAGYIFTDNKGRYDEAVEWFTVNKTANDQGFNGSVKQLFRLVDTNDLTGEKLDQPVVQHIEMGRDQAHGSGDLTNAAIISRMLLAQGTKVDPVDGTVSTSPNAVGPYEFLNDRILAAANFFSQFTLGYDTPWTPVAYAISPDGTIRDTYNQISTGYKGRFISSNFMDLYYYYTYIKQVDLQTTAPYFYEMFTKRLPPICYYGGSVNNIWDGVDGGGDFWLYIPKAVESEGAASLPKMQNSGTLLEVEERFTELRGQATAMQEGDSSFIRFSATEAGSKIAFMNGSNATKTIGFKIRTNGVATLELSSGINDTLTLPDTKGQWKYVSYTMKATQSLQDMLYLEVKGSATMVDLDHINVKAGTELTPPMFRAGNSDLTVFTYASSPLSFDFSATDVSSTDVITYELQNNPDGLGLNSSTGLFTWQPMEKGSISFVVAASDGTTVTTKNVKINVANDRASAVQAVIAPYNPNNVYVSASLAHFQAEYEKTMSQINVATDAVFNQLLQSLRSIVENLELVTPLRPDGSMHYSDKVFWSSWGSSISNMDDLSNLTGAAYTLALGSAPNLYHIVDFGPDYKVSATKFGFQSNIFSDRLANSTVYGSNDGETWTRLTPGVTSYTQEYHTLDVDPAYQNSKYRFIKLQMIQPLPDVLYGVVRNFLELTEFRIYGKRYETGNKLGAVSISSDQSVNGKIAIGDSAKVTIKAKEAIQNVNITIQGIHASVSTLDNINWIATATLDGDIPIGPVKISVDYQSMDGTNGETAVLTTDNSKLNIIDRSQYINVTKMATVTASDVQYPGTGLSKDQVGYLLFDGNTTTAGDLNTSTGSYYTVDFGEGASVRLNRIELIPRQTNSSRLNGMIVQGSNDNTNWTNLSNPVKGAQEGVWSVINSDNILSQGNYRYLKLYNSTAWSGNVAEIEFYGEYDIQNLDSKMVSSNSYTKLSYYHYQQEVERIKVAMNQPGANKLALMGKFYEAEKLLVSISMLPIEKFSITPEMVVASSVVYPNASAGSAELNGWRAFDGNVGTGTDTTVKSGWIRVDLGAGNAKSLGSFKFYPKSGSAARANGAILQGSNDGTNYMNLYTISGVTTEKWYTAPITNETAFRYLRYFTSTGFANIAELEFYGKLIDHTLLVGFLGEAGAIQMENYTENSGQQLLQAKSAAEAVMNNGTATQVEVDSAAATLRTAMDGLVYLEGVPILARFEDKKVEAEKTLTFTIETSNTVTGTVYSAGDQPAGASFSPITRTFTWTPTKEQGGVYNVTFTAKANSLSTSRTVKIAVKGNPVIAGNTDRELTATQAFSYPISASEPAGERLTFSASNLPFGATLNTNTGVFTWTPRQADYGNHPVIFQVSNGSFAVSQTVNFKVNLNVLTATPYTNGSYYLYMNEVERIRKGMEKPEANKEQLAVQLAQAEASLVPRFTLATEKIAVTSDMVLASTVVYPNASAGSPEANGWRAFDGNLSTATDTTSNPGWIRVDFGVGNAQSLGSFKFYPRSGNIARANGAILQGSNDGTNYINLYTISGVTTEKWFTAPITDDTSYRYLRYYSPSGNANIAELEFYKKPLDSTLLTLLLGKANELQEGSYYEDSYAVVQEAKLVGLAAIHNTGSTQTQIDDAASGLLQAMQGLVVKPVIVSLGSVAVITTVGTAPVLPTVVSAVYSDETVKLVPVSWVALDPSQFSTSGTFTVTGAVYGTNLPAIANVTVLDEGAPLPPTNLYAASITSSSLELFWTASSDNVAVLGYDILQDGQHAGTVTGNTYSYSFTGLAPDTSYTFKIVAFDAAGNQTPSADYTVSTLEAPDLSPPTAPTNLNASSVTTSSLVLGWTAAIDNVGVTRYDVYQGEIKAGTVTGNTYSFGINGLTADTAYTFKVVAFDAAGNSKSSANYTAKTAQGNTGGNPMPPTPTPPPTETVVTGAQIEVNSTVKDGAAQVILNNESLSKAIANAVQGKDKELVIEIKSKDAVTSLAVELPSDALLQAKQEKVKTVVIKSSLLTMNVAPDAIQDLEVGDAVKLTIDTVNPATLPASVSKLLQDKPVFEFNLTVNGQTVSTFKDNNSVEIRIPYTLKPGEKNHDLIAAYINGKGELEVVKNSKYDLVTGELVFKVKHFSTYAVVSSIVNFKDMASYSWAQISVNALASRYIVNGVGDNEFAPQQEITRAEFLKLIMEAYDLVKPGYSSTFTDTKAGEWYSDAVASAQAKKIVSGYQDGSFGLNQPISREELAVMSVRILKAAGIELPKTRASAAFHDALQIADFAASDIKSMSEAGWMEGQDLGNFAPKAQATRAEAAVLIARMMGLND